jgi:hypothetical protein
MLKYFMTIRNILLPFGMVCGHLVYFLRFGMFGQRKIWQPWYIPNSHKIPTTIDHNIQQIFPLQVLPKYVNIGIFILKFTIWQPWFAPHPPGRPFKTYVKLFYNIGSSE